MSSRQANLQEDMYFGIIKIPRRNLNIIQCKLAEKIGISVGVLNYCIKALVLKGLAKESFAKPKNKFGCIYVLTPTGAAEKAAITHSFLRRKIYEYEALNAEIDALNLEIRDKKGGICGSSSI